MTIQNTDDEEFSLKMGEEILSKLFDRPDVLTLDEDTLTEHLLFINDVKLTYGKHTFLVTSIC